MKRMKRSERIGMILMILAQNPNRLFTLSQFAIQFGCAKSTLSEDMTEVKDVLEQNQLGVLETVSGAAGGICYLPFRGAKQNLAVVQAVCERLQDSSRIVTGGFLYTLDLFSEPDTLQKLGTILAQQFYEKKPDVVVTIESKGIPAALMVAQALGKNLVIARKENRATEGSVVTINYFTTHPRLLRTMSLPRRALAEGQRALLIDDFAKGGGTIHGLCEMMDEFRCDVVGAGTLIRMPSIQSQMEEVTSLMEMDEVAGKEICIRPASWLKKMVEEEGREESQ